MAVFWVKDTKELILANVSKICNQMPGNLFGRFPNWLTMFLILCFFVAHWYLSLFAQTFFLHRYAAHKTFTMSRGWERFFFVFTWITQGSSYLSPWAYGVMHRMHHKHSDTLEDPHSPVNVGFLGIFRAQYDGYVAVEQGLKNNDPVFMGHGDDLEMGWANRTHRWYLPYVLHVVVAVIVGAIFGWPIGLALWAGAMSHPAQGAAINYFGHARGGRNFDLDDNSRNNHLTAWLVLGEGFQNNHHRWPSSARFSCRGHEVDPGYGVVRALQMLRVLRINERTLAPQLTRDVGLVPLRPVVAASTPTA